VARGKYIGSSRKKISKSILLILNYAQIFHSFSYPEKNSSDLIYFLFI